MATKQDEKSKFKERLSCALCFEVYKSPQTFPCFHSYCAECIQKLSRYRKEDKIGYYCPLCRGFAPESDIQGSFFLKDLVDLISELEENGNKLCEQCDSRTSEWKCIDCKIVLCQNCQIGHLKIPVCKGHRTIPLDDETPLILDKLIFCPKHEDEIIKFHCKTCQWPICIKCKILEHDSHHAETIESAVEEIITKVKALKEKLQKDTCIKESEKDILLACQRDIKSKFSDVKQKLKDTTQVILKKVNQDCQKLVDELNIQEKMELEKLELGMQDVNNKIKEYEGISSWATTLVEKSTGGTLIQGYYAGLHQKSKLVNGTEQSSQEISVWNWQKPAFITQKPNQESLLGIVQYTKCDTINPVQQKLPTGKHFSVAKFFKKPPILAGTIKIAGSTISKRIAIIKDSLWIPGKSHIKVLSFDGSEIDKIATTGKMPVAVAEEREGKVIVASTLDLSLYKTEKKKWHTIQKGNFCGVATENHYIAGGRTNTLEVLVLKNTNDTKDEYTILANINWTGQVSRVHIKSSIIYLHFNKQRKIMQYDIRGKETKTISTKTKDYTPNVAAKLCYIDSDNSMLFCDWYNSLIEVHTKTPKEKIFVVKHNETGKMMQIHNDIAVQNENRLLVLADSYIHTLVPNTN